MNGRLKLIEQQLLGIDSAAFQSLSFFKTAKPMTKTNVELWYDLKKAAEQARLHKQGKIKLKTAQELLNEL